MKKPPGTPMESFINPDGSRVQGFITVTEISGDLVSEEQIQRLYNRYFWTGSYIKGRDVLEVACGAGPGLGCLASTAKSLIAGDYDGNVLSVAREHYGTRIKLCRLNAQRLPFPKNTMDVVILFESIYYLKSAREFIQECRRVLRSGGRVLVTTANKDLFDFNPSPFSERYYGVIELADLFREEGFRTEFYGDSRVDDVSLRQRLLRPVKKVAVTLGLIPKSMKGKTFLKRLVFGKMVTMPSEISEVTGTFIQPDPIPSDVPNKVHKIIFCSAILN